MYVLIDNTAKNEEENNLREVEGVWVSKNGEVFNYYGCKRMRQSVSRRYLCVKYNGTTVRVHRLVAKAFPEICGEWFDGCIVDHINGNQFDNRAENLRVGTHKMNSNNPITKERQRMAGKNRIRKMRELLSE